MFILKKIFEKINNKTNNNINDDNNKNTSIDDDTIDLLKTFSSDNIDVSQIIKEILKLEPDFPNAILYSKDGHKYNELEFFQANLDSNVNSKNSSLFDKFNRTNTQLGKLLLHLLLSLLVSLLVLLLSVLFILLSNFFIININIMLNKYNYIIK